MQWQLRAMKRLFEHTPTYYSPSPCGRGWREATGEAQPRFLVTQMSNLQGPLGPEVSSPYGIQAAPVSSEKDMGLISLSRRDMREVAIWSSSPRRYEAVRYDL